jgi:hypothetical protein
MLWKNIYDKGDDIKQIKQSTSIMNFNCKFNGRSLFHHFSRNSEIIQVIQEKMKVEAAIRELEPNERNLPLLILFPDDNSKTALEASLDNQSPKSFYVMLDMLRDFGDICITKCMLNSFKYLL